MTSARRLSLFMTCLAAISGVAESQGLVFNKHFVGHCEWVAETWLSSSRDNVNLAITSGPFTALGPNVNCNTTVRAGTFKYLHVKVNQFSLEKASYCGDGVERLTFHTPGAYEGITWCGQTYAEDLYFEEAVTVVYHTGWKAQGHGFDMVISQVSSLCASAHSLTVSEKPKLIYSPLYPQEYENDLACTYKLPTQGKNVRLRSLHHSTEDASGDGCFDVLRVEDEEFCGEEDIDKLVPQDTSNLITIYFTTDSSITSQGFVLQYYHELIAGCQLVDLLHADVTAHPIKSPGSPFINGESCISWFINNPYADRRISFQVQDSDFPSIVGNCTSNFVLIYEVDDISEELDDSKQLGKFCSEQTPTFIAAKGKSLLVEFRVGSQFSGESFVAFFKLTDPVELHCPVDVTHSAAEASQNLTLTHTPRPEDGASCVSWYITNTEENKRVSLEVAHSNIHDIADKCAVNFVAIYEVDNYPLEVQHSRALGRFCGAARPTYWSSQGKSLFVEYRTNAVLARNDFVAQFRLVDPPEFHCAQTGSYTASTHSQRLSALHTPRIGQGQMCVSWYILNPRNDTRVTFEVITANISDIGDTCTVNFLAVYEVGVLTHEVADSLALGRFCGRSTPTYRSSVGKSLLVELRMDSELSHNGFEARYYVGDTAPDNPSDSDDSDNGGGDGDGQRGSGGDGNGNGDGDSEGQRGSGDDGEEADNEKSGFIIGGTLAALVLLCVLIVLVVYVSRRRRRGRGGSVEKSAGSGSEEDSDSRSDSTAVFAKQKMITRGALPWRSSPGYKNPGYEADGSQADANSLDKESQIRYFYHGDTGPVNTHTPGPAQKQANNVTGRHQSGHAATPPRYVLDPSGRGNVYVLSSDPHVVGYADPSGPPPDYIHY